MYGISEDVILGDFGYSNLVIPNSFISPSRTSYTKTVDKKQ